VAYSSLTVIWITRPPNFPIGDDLPRTSIFILSSKALPDLKDEKDQMDDLALRFLNAFRIIRRPTRKGTIENMTTAQSCFFSNPIDKRPTPNKAKNAPNTKAPIC
jgi:hypothetical protein